jgi:hypothetical protein
MRLRRVQPARIKAEPQDGNTAMSSADIANLEHASRAALAWVPEGYDGRTHYAPVVAAITAAVGILAVATTLLLSIL